MDWGPIILTLKLSVLTTALLLLVGVPLAWWLAYTRFRLRAALEALVSMPLVLPPSVLGFYLLVALSPQNGFGAFLRDKIGLQLVFSFEGLVLASVIYSLPFMVNPLLSAFRGLPPSLREASEVLGKSRWETLWRVLLPCIRPALLGAAVLSFAHTIGEFGVVLMIGGSIPGETRLASIAVFDAVEAMRYADAHAYALVLVLLSFTLLLSLYLFNQRPPRPF